MIKGKVYRAHISRTKTQFILTVPKQICEQMNFQRKEPVKVYLDPKTNNIIVERQGGLIE